MGVLLLGLAFGVYRLFDFRVFFDAGHRLLSGDELYPSRARLNQNTRDYFVYPPFVAFLFAPLSLLPFLVAGVVYVLAMLAALAGAARLTGVTDVRCYIVLLFWMPVLQAVGIGTLGPFLALSLALAWRYRDRLWLGTAPLGLVIAAKFFLWPVLLWYLLTGRMRRSVEAAVIALGALVVPWAVLGFRDLTWYPHVLRLLSRNEQPTSWSTSAFGSGQFGVVALIADVASIALVVAAARSIEGDRRAFSAAVLASLILSPLVWIHYYIVLLVPIALASRRFSLLWVLPVLAWWPFTDTHRLLGIKLWILGVTAVVALLTLRRAAPEERQQHHRRTAREAELPT